MRTSNLPFQERIRTAYADAFLQESLKKAQAKFRDGKETTYAQLGDPERWRSRAEAIRRHTIENLDYYLDQLADEIEARGGTVFFALTDEEASRYVCDLARSKRARSVVKSKSMISEEIHLNTALEKLGIEVVETDLGEYIIQLARETPSHIIVPAIHKNTKQIAALLSRVAGRELPEEPSALYRFARTILRRKFLEADIGISGCNFAVAETGSVLLVTNEGNGRFTTTYPKTHVVMMGMERIVPRWEDLDTLITLLPRAATGQKITTYLTAINGPRRPADIDGPEELHVVIVDNGRSNALGSRHQEILHCIRCGACLNVCPVYRHIGGHAYGSVYSGPIGSVLTPILDGFDGWSELPYASSLCGACTDACPVRIPLHDMLVNLRNDEIEQKRSPVFERLAFGFFGKVLSIPFLYASALRAGKLMLRLYENRGEINDGPGLLRHWTVGRTLPGPAQQSFRHWWKKRSKAKKNLNEK
jgi:L-lactate dehydrogenase complex protein LldF